MVEDLIRMLPDDFSPGAIHLRTEPELNGYSVVVSTFLGTRTNQILAHLLKNRLDGKHAVRYTQFAIRIFDWETPNAGEYIVGILEELVRMPALSCRGIPPPYDSYLEVWGTALGRSSAGDDGV